MYSGIRTGHENFKVPAYIYIYLYLYRNCCRSVHTKQHKPHTVITQEWYFSFPTCIPAAPAYRMIIYVCVPAYLYMCNAYRIYICVLRSIIPLFRLLSRTCVYNFDNIKLFCIKPGKPISLYTQYTTLYIIILCIYIYVL